VQRELTVSEDELTDSGQVHGDAAKEVVCTADTGQGVDRCSSKVEETQHGCGEWNQETHDTEEGRVSKAFSEITTGWRRLEEELLILVRRELQSDLTTESVAIVVLGASLFVLEVAVRRHIEIDVR